MTREEAIEILQEEHDWVQEPCYVIKAIEMAISALTPPTQEQLERVWPGCPYCDIAKANSGVASPLWVKEPTTSKWEMEGKALNYCPICQKPLTPEAWEELRKRWEALYENT